MTTSVAIDIHNPHHLDFMTHLLTVHDQLVLELCIFALLNGGEALSSGTWHPALRN